MTAKADLLHARNHSMLVLEGPWWSWNGRQGFGRFHVWILAWLLALPPLLGAPTASGSSENAALPPLPSREFRGAWVASVANLDWPSNPGLPSEQQKAELLAILDRAAALRMNAIILQVRPACDALYPSSLEPWSEFLTGRMGQAPSPLYDPLRFAVKEAHRRGLELHAWFNPFRVRSSTAKAGVAPNYLSQTKPSWVRKYGSQSWLDPGLRAVREHVLQVVLDVVKRYDIDGVLFDDYFYPYPEKSEAGRPLDFPDAATWQAYRRTGGSLDRSAWRRQNIDGFIQDLYRRVKAQKRWVKVGISPFGIWRPGFPKPIKGLDAYEQLYADSRKWLMNGWVDYFAPQLYWSIDGAEHSYASLLNWWVSQNTKARHLWPGNDLTKVGGSWRCSEITRQIQLTRKESGASGNILWGMANLMANSDHLSDTFSGELYTEPALVPASPWLREPLPKKPRLVLNFSKGNVYATVSWFNTGSEGVRFWFFQARRKHVWTSNIFPGDQNSVLLPNRGSSGYPAEVALTPIGRAGQAGPTAVLDLERASPPSAK